MSERYTIGRCSICGGAVKQYRVLWIVGEFPPAECDRCGAQEAQRGPVIPMEPRRYGDTRGTFAEPRSGDAPPWLGNTLCRGDGS